MAITLIAPPTKVQGSFPGATVTVYLPGTTTLATIYNDTVGTIKPNPFTADANNGEWFFYALGGVFDVQFSGGGIPAPFTLGSLGGDLNPGIQSVCDFLGVDAAQKIIAAEAILPSSGGTIDTRCLSGTQNFSVDPFVGMTKATTVIMGGATFISAVNLTVPANVNLVMLQGGIISMNTGTTLTMNGGLVGSSISPHFTGAGSFLLQPSMITAAYPQWFGVIGDGVTNNAAALQALINATFP